MFKDRADAGRQLALSLSAYTDDPNAIILALPRGGLALGYEISKVLHVPLDIILVRKLGVPGQEELAMGAISLEGVKIINENVIRDLKIPQHLVNDVIAIEEQELLRRNQVYRQNASLPDLGNKIVILVDDGIATGATMRAAIKIIKRLNPQKIIVAVPLASTSVREDLAVTNDIELLVLQTPEPFFGIGMWYHEFPQLSDEEVIEFLQGSYHASHG